MIAMGRLLKLSPFCPGTNYFLATLLLTVLTNHFSFAQQSRSACYDSQGRPQRCIAEFVNAAYEVKIESTNTCGYDRTLFCLQTGVTGATKSCDECVASDPNLRHPPRYMTDYNSDQNTTWWQSETMYENIQYPHSVNLTLPLGKSFEVTYVRLKFHTSRPESFAIYKKTVIDGEWIPWQYYSGSCQSVYNQENRGVIVVGDETKPICTDEFSDISPLTGGNVAFSTLEGRPSAYDFDNSLVLQEWVTATDILVTLNRLNTFGDEVFRDPNVLRSYYYAISDFAVGGRCKCNGHASECVRSTGDNGDFKVVCRCEHNTAGPDCNECLPFYNDVPWKVATATNAHECQACDCNGLSNRCYFNEDLFERTGHGGYCVECRLNTAGPNCERCRDDYYRTSPTDFCQPCHCNATGSVTTQCDETGRCICKPGVTGEKCVHCMPDFYDFSVTGCRPCACTIGGSLNNDPRCRPDTGICTCKVNVEGLNCDKCKPGYFNLREDNEFGCSACFCYGHASVCTSASGFTPNFLEYTFDSGAEGWTVEDSRGDDQALSWIDLTKSIRAQAPDLYPYYFIAPDEMLGNQRFSYGQELSFTFRVDNDDDEIHLYEDLIIQGAGYSVTLPLTAQGNPQPSTVIQEYKYRLHQDPSYGWRPTLSAFEMQRMLTELTAIKIRATYQDRGVGFLDNVKLATAGSSSGFDEVDWVELCQCPDGYVGQFCEDCAAGYRRENPNSGAFSRCIPCECNGHSSACDVLTGACLCEHNTQGDNCEQCKSGYYGNARQGTEDDCTKCPCPNNGECLQIPDGEVVCTNCDSGYTGTRCEMCADGYYGDPLGDFGSPQPCRECLCNGNIDSNAVANCDGLTGECLKCIYNTAGYYCQDCLPGYYGDAISEPKGQCKPCDCYLPGSRGAACHPVDGQCDCQPYVRGRNCSECRPGYWNIDSGTGCIECNCNYMGSLNGECEISTGNCICQPGVTGEKCDRCLPHYYGFSQDGCSACNCDPQGSLSLQCDDFGQCLCKDGVIGEKCDMCSENRYNLALGCIACPACYDLVQDKVDEHRKKLNELRDLIDNIGSNPEAINDEDFEKRLKEVNDTINQLLKEAKMAAGNDTTLLEHLDDIKDSIDGLQDQLQKIGSNVDMAQESTDSAKDDIGNAEDAIKRAQDTLAEAERYLNEKGQEALDKAADAAKDLGSQSEKMTKLAKKAKEAAEQQTEEAMEIDGTANEALDTSKEALKLAQDALDKQDDISDKIDMLKDKYDDIEALAQEAMAVAMEAQERANELLKEATTILADANSPLPTIDVGPLKGNASDIIRGANRIKAEADQLIADNRDLLKEVEMESQEAKDLLQDGLAAQQEADLLLARVDAAEAIAQAAINQGDKTVKEARDMLDTLRGFNDLVEESKGAAEDALDRIPEIERLIREANDTANEANDAIEGAEADAIQARDIANEAETTAVEASEGAGQVKEDAEETLDDATGLSDEAMQLMMDVDDTEQELDELDKQADNDAALAQEALMKANEARRNAQEASDTVQSALSDVNDLLNELAHLEPIDLERLNELEGQLADTNDTLQDADLDNKLEDLKAARDQQKQWIMDYEDALVDLRAAVQNIRDINDSLPDQCYREETLENPP
uniref:Laminin subunit gamma-1-like n=1 Tax=Saccoglossus kowalevskii TaxID=10224 RepID=A0ABM0GJA2_SACKO|nr:PREDICTED: laminin subunit gamma-1-like [Saccoglossus kowalevskii]